MNRPEWNKYFMMMAKLVASRSTCASRPVGAVITKNNQVIATGYNGAPPGEWHCSDKGCCHWRTLKAIPGEIEPKEQSRAIHAEMNAIGQAAKHGISTQGAEIYCTLSPCIPCFKTIVAAGITKILFEHVYDNTTDAQNKALFNFYAEFAPTITLEKISITGHEWAYMNGFMTMTPTSKRRHKNY